MNHLILTRTIGGKYYYYFHFKIKNGKRLEIKEYIQAHTAGVCRDGAERECVLGFSGVIATPTKLQLRELL